LKARAYSTAGFSLIEMLMVLFVVVLMTSLVSLNLDSGASDRDLQNRLESLLAVASLALDEAQETGSDYGLLFVQDAGEGGEAVIRGLWRQRLNVGWRSPRDGDGVYAPIEFPAGVDLTLVLDGVAVAPALAAAAADETLGRAPQWLFTASGETQTGELILSDRELGDLRWRVTWDALGRFERFRGDELEPEAGLAQGP
jgi:prepilin-type N-terminal cleavage/methylation domain-containing protein